MNDSETDKMRSLFLKYYSMVENLYVNELNMREIGYIPFKGSMIRHQRVDPGNSGNGMKIFAIRNVPRHLYNSVAFYKKPDERIMKEKEWQGAELIFDLDADHIEGSSSMSYEETLDEVKRHTDRLINHFLVGELGISADSMSLFFSGGRGYHVHVTKEGMLELNSDQRREISNLIRGEGLKAKEFTEVAKLGITSGNGWKNEIDSLFTDELRIAMESNELEDPLLKRIGKHYEDRNNLKLMNKKKILVKNGPEKYRNLLKDELELLDRVILNLKNSISCEIDEPVTTDTHRLIRFPNSLHGKTGFMVKRINIEDLRKFNPLDESIPEAFMNGEMTVKAKSPFTINLMKRRYIIDGIVDVPTYVAVYTVLSGKGTLE